jgi:hypothetical protein
MDNLSEENNFCIISEKLAGRLSSKDLEEQISENYLFSKIDNVDYENCLYAEINCKNNVLINSIVKKIKITKNKISLSLLCSLEELQNLYDDFEIINLSTYSNKKIKTYHCNDFFKKSIEFNDNKYITVKLKFRK